MSELRVIVFGRCCGMSRKDSKKKAGLACDFLQCEKWLGKANKKKCREKFFSGK